MSSNYAKYSGLGGGGGSVTAGDLTDVGTDGITITGGTGAVIGSGTQIAQHVADTTHNGYLSSTDWNTFNSKQATLTIGTLDGQSASAAGATIASNQLFMQSADATHPGLVNNTTQTLSGVKTFSSNPVMSSLTASQAVVTDSGKSLASLAYTSANTVSTLVQRDSSGNFSAGTITAALSGNATTATTATNSTNVATTQVSTNTSFFPLFVASSTNGNQACDLGTGLTFNPSTNTLTTTTFSGNASTATTATNATNVGTTQVSNSASYFPLMVSSSTNGNQACDLSTGLTFNPSTNVMGLTGLNVGAASVPVSPAAAISVGDSGIVSVRGTTNAGFYLGGAAILAFTSTGYEVQSYGGSSLYLNRQGNSINFGNSGMIFDVANGRLGVGQTSPTAYLHLHAGSTSASTAPIKFAAGTNMTSAEAGAMEWDGTNLYVTQTTGPTRKTLVYTDVAILSSLASVGTITTGVWNGTAVDATHGGTAQTSWTSGDIMYASAANTLSKLSKGSDGQVLTLASGLPSWAGGAANLSVTSQSTTYNVLTTDNVVLLTTSGNYTVTLPTAVGVTGKQYFLKKVTNDATNIITIATTSSQTIDGYSTVKIATLNEEWSLVSDGSNWQVLSHKTSTAWVSYTPTFVGLGTVTSNNGFWRRIGDSVQIRGTVTTATTSGSNFTVSPPTGMTIDSSKLSSTASGTFVGTAYDTENSTITYGGGVAMLFYDGSDTGNIYGAKAAGTTTFTKGTGSGLFTNNSVMTYSFSVPVSGWYE